MSEELEIIKHVVQKNETLVGIALKYDMKVEQLKKLNRLFSNNAFEGQILNVQVKKGHIIPTPPDNNNNNNNNNNNKPPSIVIPTTEPILALHLLSSSPSSSLSQLLASSPSPSLAQLLSSSPLLPPGVTISSSSSLSTPIPSAFSTSASIPSLLAPPTPNKLKLSTSVPNSSFLDLIGVTLPADRSTSTESGTTHSKLMHKRSEVWDMAGITKPHEVVTCYAKYVPVHGMQVTGVLTITPTRVIFEPNLDDPGVTKDGLLAHQFSVESGRLLEVETFQDDVTFRGRLAKQLADQAQWDVPPPKKEKRRNLESEKSKRSVEGDKQKKNAEGKTERLKRLKKFKPSSSKIKVEDPVIHFDPTTEEMLQIVCSGRYRPKNYANFILPKEKGDVIYQRMVLFLSGSKEERLKAYLNLDVSTPTTSPARGKLRRQHSFSSTRPSDSEALEELKSRYGLADTTVRPEIHQATRPQVVKRDKQPAPKLKKEKSKTEEKVMQDVEITKKKRAEAEQAKQLKEQQKKEKKAAKEAAKEASTEKRRGSISDKWRSRKTGDPSMKSPPTSPILPKLTSPPTPTSTPPLSPLVVTADTVLPPALDISETTRPAVPGITAADQQEEEAGFLPSLLDESLIFSADDMHELRRYLPGYYKWMDWKLLYSTQNNGISMSTFLHRTREHTPTLFIMEDSNGFVFGGFATAPWAIHTGYFGTGQSFLFSLKPKVHVYEWTRANPFFMLMTPNAIAMGGDKEGRHGFWIDTNFEFGVSEMCSTYFNRCLASTERFKCTIVEVWTLTDGGKDKRK